MVYFWDPTYRCFTFNEVDMVPTINEYSTLLHYDFRDPLRILEAKRRFLGTLSQFDGITCRYSESKIKR
ncbi:hypothetical protein Gohar_018745 [Gossypium harknessii]|uniref:DUF7745 domain-containing protein n=1 Tax=Gossypium harknessii TaxID=34285 RepID=A0A7J9GA15_9ROSI|nr:hypothetical protein [Gossypium harknessii]